MSVLERIATGVYQVGEGVHSFLIDLAAGRPGADEDEAWRHGLVLIDTGMDPRARLIGEGIRDLRCAPADLRAVVCTHLHGDHVGGLGTVERHTNAEVWMHPADAALVRQGRASRGRWRFFGLPALPVPRPQRQPLAVAHEVHDGEVLPFAGLRVIHTPGHTAGHIALLLPRDGGVLFTGDSATGRHGVSGPPITEDPQEAERSLHKLAACDFEIAAFAHGRPILTEASARFRERWPVC